MRIIKNRIKKHFPFDSAEEKSFAELLEYMKLIGEVEGFDHHPESYKLFTKRDGLREHVYTPDFKVKFIKDIGYGHEAVFEIKGTFDFQNMSRLVVLNCKWVMDKFNERVYVLKIKSKTKKQSIEEYYKQIFIIPIKVRKSKIKQATSK